MQFAQDGEDVFVHVPVRYWLAPHDAAVVHATQDGDVYAEHVPLR